jgi:hypothetical protein
MKSRPLVQREAERVLQAHVVALPVAVAELEEVAARERQHLPARALADGADDVRLAVGDVERAAVARESRRLRERGLVARAVERASRPEPAKTVGRRVFKSSCQIWCGPAIAT